MCAWVVVVGVVVREVDERACVFAFGGSIIFFFFQAEDGIRDSDM